MTTIIVSVSTPDGTRTFELLVTLDDPLVVADTCMELVSGQREWRDTRDVLLLVGRKRGDA